MNPSVASLPWETFPDDLDKDDVTCADAIRSNQRETFDACYLHGGCMSTRGARALRAAVAMRDQQPYYYNVMVNLVPESALLYASLLEKSTFGVRDALARAATNHVPEECVFDSVRVLFGAYDSHLRDMMRAVPELLHIMTVVVEQYVIPALWKVDDHTESDSPVVRDCVQSFAAFIRDGFRSASVCRLVKDARSVAVVIAADGAPEYRVDVEARLLSALLLGDEFGLRLLLAMTRRDQSSLVRLLDSQALIFRVPAAFQPTLLAAGVNVNAVDPSTRATLLNVAICQSRSDLVALILSRPGVDPNAAGQAAGQAAAYPLRNGCLGNAIRLRRYDIAEQLLNIGATVDASFVNMEGMVRPLLYDVSMDVALFERLLPFADMAQHRDVYLRFFGPRMVGEPVIARKVELIVRRYGATVKFVVAVLKALCDNVKTSHEAILSLLRAAMAADLDPCAFDAHGRTMFSVLHACARSEAEHRAFVVAIAADAEVGEEGEDAAFALPRLPRLPRFAARWQAVASTEEAAASTSGRPTTTDSVSSTIRAAWSLLEPSARVLPSEHPDAITRFTSLSADEYLEIARKASSIARARADGSGGAKVKAAKDAVVSAFRMAMRALSRWRTRGAGGGRDGASVSSQDAWLFRYVGLWWAFSVILRPSRLLAHRVRVLARARARMREMVQVVDQVTGDEVEPDDIFRCVLFSPAKVWCAYSRRGAGAARSLAPPPRLCVDLVNFARASAERKRAPGQGFFLSGIHYDEESCAELMTMYYAFKARMDPSRESWLSPDGD